MRKTISLVLVAAMLLTMMVFAPTASAVTLDENNVQIDAQYFSGTTVWTEIEGTNQYGFSWFDPITIKEGGDHILNLDGIIEDGEWTEKVYHIDSDYAPQSGLAYGNNSLFEVPSAENTFYRWIKDGNNASLAPADGLEYDVRFMWDEQYFYMAVEYLDGDGYTNSGTAASANNWDGDAIQFRLDPNGANASVGGQGYDASVDSYPYDPEIHGEIDNTLNCTFPWTDDETEFGGDGQEKHSTLGNFIVSYYTSGYTDISDASKRYFPQKVEVDVDDGNGNITTEIQTVYSPADISTYGQLSEEDYAYATVYPHDIDPRPPFVLDQVTYEIALPWSLIIDGGYNAEAGAELGFSMVRFNAQLGKGPFNSYLAWGSGLCGYETKEMPQVCGGSNALVLTDEDSTAAVNCEHTFADPTCINPETCTACGYERGFVAGHKNEFSNQSLPTGSSNGSISAKCKVCGEEFTKTLSANQAYVKHDFLETDSSIYDQGWYAEGGFCIQWETLDENGARYTDETDPTGTLRQKLWNKDGTAKNAFDKDTFGYSVADLTIDGQTGTYFEAESYSKSYAEAMDVYFTNLPTTSELIAKADPDQRPYNTFFGNWFGGDGTYGGGNGVYALAGLVSVEDQWYFAIYPASHQNPDSIEELDEYAYCYTAATAEQIALNTWHEYTFMFDNDAETAMLFWDGELVAAATDYHFPSTNDHAILLQHNAQSYVKNIEIGSTGLAAAKTGWQGNGSAPADKFTVTVDGVATEVEAGSTFEISAETVSKNADGDFFRFLGWTGDVDGIADATASTTTVVVNSDITIESSYYMIGDTDLNGTVNSLDSNAIKRMIANKISATTEGDVDGDGMVTPLDSNFLKRLIVGTWSPLA